MREDTVTGSSDRRNTQSTVKLKTSDMKARRSMARVLPVTLFAVIAVAVVLLPGILSEDTELPQTATDTGDIPVIANTATVTPTVALETVQTLSPAALEDLRAIPIDSLTVDPQPLLLELLPGEPEAITEAEEPTLAGPEPEAQEETTPVIPEEPFSVGEALARYLLVIRAELNSEYVANCIRHRNRSGAGADCPTDPAIAEASPYQAEKALVDELFAIITREGEYARISSRLESENARLNTILAAPGNAVAALQASTKLALNNAYLNYLNSNLSPDVVRFQTMNNFVNDYNRTIMAGPTQFRCQGGPCEYEFTGIGAE
jgi:hypothetical protein